MINWSGELRVQQQLNPTAVFNQASLMKRNTLINSIHAMNKPQKHFLNTNNLKHFLNTKLEPGVDSDICVEKMD